MPRSAVAVLAVAAAVAGCGSGCRDRARPADPPRTVPGADTGSAAPPDGELPAATAATGFLDAPAGSLDRWFAALAAAERRAPTGRALMLVFGDSHTAGDAMTSRFRHVLQARFGDAGRGLVAAGKPTARHYYQRDVRYGASGRWRSAVGGVRDPEPFGIAGLRIYGEQRGAQLWVETCAGCAGASVAQLEVLYLAAPDHGALRLRVDDGAWQPLSTATTGDEPAHPARHVVVVPDGPHRLTLEHAGGGAVDLFGVVLERGIPGVIVDSLGVVGRRLGSLRSWDWSIIGEQLATRDPRLVVLQYGTNEADDRDLSLEDLARSYDDTIRRIRAAAPTASILVLGPPDLGVREAGKACDRIVPRPDLAAIPECSWRTPGVLREIIAVAHAAARRNGAAFFDTFAALGGADQIDAWHLAEPRLAARDRVHFTDLGYQRWADAVLAAMLAAYAAR